MHFIRTLDEIEIGDRDLVGGKALGLGRLTRAGFAVPKGYCITTLAYQSWVRHGRKIESELARQILAAHADLSAAEIAVRSSLPIEDSDRTSLAGLTETRLGKWNGPALLEVVEQLWAQTDSGVLRGYLDELGIPDTELAVAIVVQTLVPADVAGVLMTRDPLQPSSRDFVVEAAWGLGESVVSGEVVPDRYRLDRASGIIVEQKNGLKSSRRTIEGREAVPEALHRASCLNQANLSELAACGRSIAELFGQDCDIEWARAAGKLWLLQSRPITTDNSSEQTRLRQEEIEYARSRAEPGGTVWIRNEFARELPEPTPMTWSILKRMFSARGGYGQMYRDLGFHPAAVLNESGCYDLICGRLYCNMSREPQFYANGLPLVHDLDSLRQTHQQASEPRPKLALERAGAAFWFQLPWHIYQAIVLPRRLQRACQEFLSNFRTRTLPPYRRLLERAKKTDWSLCDPEQLLKELHQWIEFTLCDYAREALKAGVLGSQLEGAIRTQLSKTRGAKEIPAIMAEIAGDIPLEAEVNLVDALRALAQGTLDRQSFLARFGHRCGSEWELAQPRWSESADAIANLPLAGTFASKGDTLPSEIPRALMEQVTSFRQFLGLRELAKHHLLEGYGIIRHLLLEWDRRSGLDGGCFYLTLEDLDGRVSVAELKQKSSRARRRRRLLLGLPMPAFLSSDNLEAIGRSAPIEDSINQTLHGIAVSPGTTEGSAFVPKDPVHDKPPSGPFVLVCVYTDPAWIALVAQARGLIMETGGLLSHGAILARELGVPAVCGVSDASRLLAGGCRVRVDGSGGSVTILS